MESNAEQPAVRQERQDVRQDTEPCAAPSQGKAAVRVGRGGGARGARREAGWADLVWYR